MAIVQADGAAIDVEQRGAGRDLVLLHSLLTDRSVFDRAVPELAATRRLWLVNLPGYGASAPAGTDIESYAERIASLLDALRLPRNTDVLGNGFGGFVAVALAARHGERIGRLVAAPALRTFPEPAKPPFQRLAGLASSQGMAAVLDLAIERMLPQAFIDRNPGIVAERKRALEKADPACFATACRALAKLDFSPVLEKITSPTLVMVGSLDATTPPALARELAAGIRGARFCEIPGCGHCPQLEEPRAFAAAVEEFLSA